ncbi:hypothetical protein [Thermococcus sp. JCM 11816]|uniref:hypothetical protein n=1 Tax=Thermococcus sp. (strain JCM 11816 / KS-1) TaxID=1295125 RepID=UPI003467BB9B
MVRVLYRALGVHGKGAEGGVGFPDNIIEFIYRFLLKYDRVDLPEDDEEEEIDEEAWII